MNMLKKLIGYLLFLPAIGFYSFILGPLLIMTLVPGGVLVFLLILGYRDGVLVFKRAMFRRIEQDIIEVPFNDECYIGRYVSDEHFKDMFIFSSQKLSLTAKEVYHGIFAYLPSSVVWLLKVRNQLVRYIGFSATNSKMSASLNDIQTGMQAGFLTFKLVSDKEVICSSSEKNMDLWLSVSRLSDTQFSVATVVNLKTWQGRWYMAVIKPFHKLIAPYCIKRALSANRI